ncbi:hypothetical protein ABPG77_007971 [Micractinium sp. CCAP 211/92]
MIRAAVCAALLAACFPMARAAVSKPGPPSTFGCTCSITTAAAARGRSCVCPSTSPPGGLRPSETPQFILLTHDDAITPTAAAAFRAILGGRSSADGCPAVATLFTLARGTDCELLRRLYLDGYEVASHSLTHQKMNGWSREQVAAEVVGGRSALASKCGIPGADIVGWRQPYLQASPTVRQVVKEAGFLYDSTILETPEGESVSQGMAARLWPYTLQDGVAQDCKSWAPYQTCGEGESYPELFEVPVWDLSPTGLFSTDPADRGGRSILQVLNSTFQAAYKGNRAPMPIFVHSSFFSAEGVAALQRFADYALSLPHVHFVTVRQLLGWMRQPTPAAQLTPAMLGCGNVGGAGPEGHASRARSALAAAPQAAGLQGQQAPAAAPVVGTIPAKPNSRQHSAAQAASEQQQERQESQADEQPLMGAAARHSVPPASPTATTNGSSSSNWAAIVGASAGGALAALAALTLAVAAVQRRCKRAVQAAASQADMSTKEAEHMGVYAARIQPGASAFLSVGGRVHAGPKPSLPEDMEFTCVVQQTGTPGSSARRRGPSPFC